MLSFFITFQVKLMRDYKRNHSPTKLSTETWSASQTTASQPTNAKSFGPSAGSGYGEDVIKPAHNTSTQFSADSRGRGRTPSVPNDNTSMVVQVSQVGSTLVCNN